MGSEVPGGSLVAHVRRPTVAGAVNATVTNLTSVKQPRRDPEIRRFQAHFRLIPPCKRIRLSDCVNANQLAAGWPAASRLAPASSPSSPRFNVVLSGRPEQRSAGGKWSLLRRTAPRPRARRSPRRCSAPPSGSSCSSRRASRPSSMPPARQFRRQPDPARVGGHVLDAGGSRAAAWNRSPTISGESGTTRSAVAGLGAARRVRIARATPPFGAGQTRRPPPAGAGSVVNRCGGGWSAVADAPSAPGESLASVLATCHPPRRRTRDGGVMDSRAASSRDALQQVGGTSSSSLPSRHGSVRSAALERTRDALLTPQATAPAPRTTLRARAAPSRHPHIPHLVRLAAADGDEDPRNFGLELCGRSGAPAEAP